MVDKNERGQDLLAAFAEGANLTDVELREALLAAHRQIGQLEIENVRLKEEVEDQATLIAVQGEHIDELTQELADTEVALAHSAAETMEATEQWRTAEKEFDCTKGQLEAQKQQNAALEKAATTDPLTGLLNRNGGEIHYVKLANRALRRTRELADEYHKNKNREIGPYGPKKAFICPLFIDIDYFKKVNDEHGHDVGDQVLISVAQTLQESIRENDVLFRTGGEEMVCYAIIEAHSLNEAKREAVKNIAERMRMVVKEKGYYAVAKDKDNDPDAAATRHDLTISIGVDAFLPPFLPPFHPPFLQPEKFHVPTIEELNNRPTKEVYACMKAADQADYLMYQAKENGRNAVVYYDDELRGRIVIFGRENEVLVIKTKEEKAEEERAKEAEKQKKGPQPLPLIDHMRKHVSGFQWPRTAPHP